MEAELVEAYTTLKNECHFDKLNDQKVLLSQPTGS